MKGLPFKSRFPDMSSLGGPSPAFSQKKPIIQKARQAKKQSKAIPMYKKSQPAKQQSTAFSVAANFANSLLKSEDPQNKINSFNDLQLKKPVRPAERGKKPVQQPRSLPGAKKVLDNLISMYQFLDTVDFSNNQTKLKLIKAIRQSDLQAFTIMTNGSDCGNKLTEILIYNSDNQKQSVFNLAIEVLNETDYKANALAIVERLIELRYPLKFGTEDQDIAAFSIADVESNDIFLILLNKIYSIYGTVDIRNQNNQTFLHAIAQGQCSLLRVVQIMRYGINTDFPLSQVSEYLKENQNTSIEEKQRVLKFLMFFYSFDKKKNIIVAYEMSRKLAMQKCLGKLNKFMFIKLLRYAS